MNIFWLIFLMKSQMFSFWPLETVTNTGILLEIVLYFNGNSYTALLEIVLYFTGNSYTALSKKLYHFPVKQWFLYNICQHN